MNGERNLIGRSLFRDALAIILALAAFGVVLFLLAFGWLACAKLFTDTRLSSLSEPLKQGVEEKYGYVIPDNAQLISGTITDSRDDVLELLFSVELDGLEGYERGMEPSDIYLLMWDGRISDTDYGFFAFDGIEEVEKRHNVKFAWRSSCDRAPFSGIAMSEPKDGRITVLIYGYRPSTAWLK